MVAGKALMVELKKSVVSGVGGHLHYEWRNQKTLVGLLSIGTFLVHNRRFEPNITAMLRLKSFVVSRCFPDDCNAFSMRNEACLIVSATRLRAWFL